MTRASSSRLGGLAGQPGNVMQRARHVGRRHIGGVVERRNRAASRERRKGPSRRKACARLEAHQIRDRHLAHSTALMGARLPQVIHTFELSARGLSLTLQLGQRTGSGEGTTCPQLRHRSMVS